MIRREVVVSGDTLGQQWRGIPAVELSPGGRLFVAWFSGGEKEPDPRNAVFLQTSEDAGRSFSTPQVMADPPGETRVFDPCLWRDPGGLLWLFYNQSALAPSEHGVWARCCADSDAPAPTWSAPRWIGFEVPFCFRLNKPTVLSSGEWLLPVTWGRRPTTDHWFILQDQLQGVGISRDQGQTWELHGAVEAPFWALENMIVEQTAGRLVMYIRTSAGHIYQSLSEDRGLTWSESSPTSIVHPGARFFVGKLQSGRWLLLNSPRPDCRTGLSAHLSEDEGATWSAGVLLDDRTEVSYPDATQAADGTIYAVHDRERYQAREILLSVFREDDVS